MITVSKLARRFGVSRSTLLYYDRIGLLTPSGRSEANYRLYSEADATRLARIDTFRRAGVPLADIASALETDEAGPRAALEARLRAINGQIADLRHQQRLIATLLRDDGALARARSLDKAAWVAVLRASGMDEADMSRWHAEFERLNPQAHQDFLESLGLPPEEIETIRANAGS